MAHTEAQDRFYKTQRWRDCRKAYAASVGGLCERCLAKGVVTPGEIVHHKIHLDDSNLQDPTIALDWNNLELVCRKCHGELHEKTQRRYEVDEFGRVKNF